MLRRWAWAMGLLGLIAFFASAQIGTPTPTPTPGPTATPGPTPTPTPTATPSAGIRNSDTNPDMPGIVDFGTNSVRSTYVPTRSNDLVNLAYVDSVAAGTNAVTTLALLSATNDLNGRVTTLEGSTSFWNNVASTTATHTAQIAALSAASSTNTALLNATNVFTGGTNTFRTVLPAASNLYDLGSSTLPWKDVFIGTNTLYFGDQSLTIRSGALWVNGSSYDAVLAGSDNEFTGENIFRTDSTYLQYPYLYTGQVDDVATVSSSNPRNDATGTGVSLPEPTYYIDEFWGQNNWESPTGPTFLIQSITFNNFRMDADLGSIQSYNTLRMFVQATIGWDGYDGPITLYGSDTTDPSGLTTTTIASTWDLVGSWTYDEFPQGATTGKTLSQTFSHRYLSMHFPNDGGTYNIWQVTPTIQARVVNAGIPGGPSLVDLTTLAGVLATNSPTTLNADNLASGTVPLARLSGVTSNQIATATDTDYRNYTGWANYADDYYTSTVYAVTANVTNEVPLNAGSVLETQLPEDLATMFTPARLYYDAETAPFTVGATLTGGTSGDTAVITRLYDGGTTGILYLAAATGDFQDDETITDNNGSPGSATANGIYTPGKILGRNGDGLNVLIEMQVRPNTANTTYYDVWVDIGGSVGSLYRRTTSLPKGNGVWHDFSMSVAGYTLDTWEANGGTIYIVANQSISLRKPRVLLTRTHKAR